MSRRYQAVVFDLFGTVVHLRGRPDPAIGWLREPLAALHPEVDFEAFRRALREVSMELVAARAADHREVSSAERFARALSRVGVTNPAVATALSSAHMAHIADQTHLPAGHDAVLGELAARHRVGLVSNFDHAATAHAVLARHGVAHHFAVTLISDAFGRRKPHPSIFVAALDELGVQPGDALYVGDTHADDVVGALAAGMDVAWIAGPDSAAAEPQPTYRIAGLADLSRLLRRDD